METNVTPALVSVIIPTHNRRKRLSAAIESVFAQTYSHLEVIVVNDASTDDTATWLESLAQKKLTIINNPQSKGGAVSRNIGVQAANGTYIAFLDDDDTWEKTKIEKQIQLLEQENAVAANCYFTNHHLPRKKAYVQKTGQTKFKAMLLDNMLGGASVCICRKKVFEQVNGFNSALPSAQDWDLWLKLVQCGKIVTVKEPLVNYYAHQDARISTNWHNKYIGQKLCYEQYKPLMDKAIKHHHLAMIGIYGILSEPSSLTQKLKTLFYFFKHGKLKFYPRCRFIAATIYRLMHLYFVNHNKH